MELSEGAIAWVGAGGWVDWTNTSQCATTPTAGNSSMIADNLGAGSAYWTTWSFDTLGDRANQTQHAFTGGPATDTSTTYGYGTSGNQPHSLTSASTTAGGTTSSYTYGYGAAGNMTSRNAGQGQQTLTYDTAGHLGAITGSTAGNSSFEYTADGSMFIQKDPGTTTVYVGDQQFALNTGTGTVTGTRYYSLPGGGTVVRTGSTGTAFKYAISDNHRTPVLYLDNTATNPTWRQYTPYGEPRGAATPAPDNHGFLNKAMDTSTGLTIIGARQYDPTIGRFITIDPILETAEPTQLNGYGYAGNNPVVHTDPTGLRPWDPEIDTQFGEPQRGTGSYDEHYAGSPANGNTSGGSGVAQSSPAEAPIGHLSPHVLMHTDDPRFATLQQQYHNNMDSFDCLWGWGQCHVA